MVGDGLAVIDGEAAPTLTRGGFKALEEVEEGNGGCWSFAGRAEGEGCEGSGCVNLWGIEVSMKTADLMLQTTRVWRLCLLVWRCSGGHFFRLRTPLRRRG